MSNGRTSMICIQKALVFCSILKNDINCVKEKACRPWDTVSHAAAKTKNFSKILTPINKIIKI